MAATAHKLAQFASELQRRSYQHSSVARLALSRRTTAPSIIHTPGRRIHSEAARTAAEDADLPAAMLDTVDSSSAADSHVRDTITPSSRLPLDRIKPIHSASYQLSYSPARPHIQTTGEPTEPPSTTNPAPLTLTPNLRALLPQLTAQPPLYITIHIHGFPYLVTAGDTIRLPFHMHGVLPGDILRLNRASRIGSRDWTLLAGRRDSASPSAEQSSPTPEIIGRTEDLQLDPPAYGNAPQTRRKGPLAHLDDRLFVARATVLGTESEPMRFKEKTKRRQRHIRRVKSKHRSTVLRVSEVRVRGVQELDGASDGAVVTADGASDGLEGTG